VGELNWLDWLVDWLPVCVKEAEKENDWCRNQWETWPALILISGKQPGLGLTTRCEPWILQVTKRGEIGVEEFDVGQMRWERRVRKRKD